MRLAAGLASLAPYSHDGAKALLGDDRGAAFGLYAPRAAYVSARAQGVRQQ